MVGGICGMSFLLLFFMHYPVLLYHISNDVFFYIYICIFLTHTHTHRHFFVIVFVAACLFMYYSISTYTIIQLTSGRVR